LLYKISLLIYFIPIFIYHPYSHSNEKKLIPIDTGIYAGAFPDLGGTEDIVTLEKLGEFELLSGKKPAWIYFSNNWFKGIKFPAEEVKIIDESGSVPFIRLMPRSDYNNYEHPETGFTLDRIIRGDFDEELKKWAADAKEFDKPILIEFGTEVNGDWFPWNGKQNGNGEKIYGDVNEFDGPEKFKDAYRHIINIFRNEGADNLTWFYHVNAYSSPDAEWNKMNSYYPGDDYIDWIGVSVYGPQLEGEEWKTFSQVMDEKYTELAAITFYKPIAVLEFGVTENSGTGDKA
jgi:hypothetical protein